MTHWRALTRLFFIAALLTGCSDPPSTIEHRDQSLQPAPAPPPPPGSDATPVAEDLGVPQLQKAGADMPLPFTVNAGGDQVADASLLVTLNGSLTNASESPLISAHWVQEQGASAAILSPRSLQTGVILPDVRQAEVLAFRLYGVNAEGYVESDTALVTVQPLERQLRVIHVAIEEGSASADFAVRLNRAFDEPLTVSYSTESGTAQAGEDFSPLAGNLIFAAGVTEQSASVPLFDDAEFEGDEYFQLHVQAMLTQDDQTQLLNAHGLALISDDEPVFRFPTVTPVDEGPSNLEQQDLPGTEGLLRMQLAWQDEADNLNLFVTDPCGNRISTLNAAASCSEVASQLQLPEQAAPWQSVFWQDLPPAGWYSVGVEHFAGLPADYDLRVFVDGQSHWFSGTIGRGDTVEVFRFEYPGEGGAGKPDSGASSSAGSAASSGLSSSSTSSSSTSAGSSSTASSSASASSSSTSSSSSSTSSSASSSSSTSSSSSSSGGILPITVELDSPVPGQEVFNEVLLEGTLSWDSSASITELSVQAIASSAPGESVEFALALAEGSFSSVVDLSSLPDGPIDLTVAAADSLSQTTEMTTTINKRTPSELAITWLTAIEEPPLVVFERVLLQASVASDPAIGINDLVMYIAQEDVIVSQSLLDAWDPASNTLAAEISAGLFDLADGEYRVTLTATDAVGRSVSTPPLAILLHSPSLPSINLTEPTAGDYHSDIPVQGNISVDQYASPSLSAELTSASTEFSPRVIALGREGTAFYADIAAEDLPDGTYTLSLSLNDGIQTEPATATATFNYRAYLPLEVQLLVPEINAEPLVVSDRYLSVFGLAATDELAEITGLNLYLSDGQEGETALSLLDMQAYSATVGEFELALDMLNLALSAGSYDLWVEAEDSLGRVAVSIAAQLQFEPFAAPEISAEVSPVNGEISGYAITGFYTADPRAGPVSVAYQLDINGAITTDSIVLDSNADEFQFFIGADQVPAGAHSLWVEITDAFGRQAQTAAVTLNKSLNPPALQWISPQAGQELDGDTVQVIVDVAFDEQLTVPEWQIEDQLALTLNGELITPDWQQDAESGYWFFNLSATSLASGENTLDVTATDPRDAAVMNGVVVVLNYQPQPGVRILNPVSGTEFYAPELTGGAITLDASVSLANGDNLAEIQLLLNGELLEDYSLVQAAPGDYSWQLPQELFNTNTGNNISVQAISNQGLVQNSAVDIVLWSDQAIRIVSPANDQSVAAPVRVQGVVRSDLLPQAGAVSVKLNGQALFESITLNELGAFSFVVPEALLVAGEPFEITAEVMAPEALYSVAHTLVYDPAAIAEGGDVILLTDLQAVADENLDWLAQWFDFEQGGVQDATEVWLDFYSAECGESCVPQQTALQAAAEAAGLKAGSPTLGDGRYVVIPDSVKAIVILAPLYTYASDEVALFRQFLARGGRLILVADYIEFYAGGDEVINPLLSQLGVGMQLNRAFENASAAKKAETVHRLNSAVDGIVLDVAGGIDLLGNALPLYQGAEIVAAVGRARLSELTDLTLLITSPNVDGQYTELTVPLQWRLAGNDNIVSAGLRLTNSLFPQGRLQNITACFTAGDCLLKAEDLKAQNTIELTVTDASGNSASAYSQFVFDMPPRIEIFEPDSPRSIEPGESVIVRGRVVYSTETLLGVYVSVNNYFAEVPLSSPGGEFEITVPASDLFSGDNRVLVEAYDQYERAGQAVLQLVMSGGGEAGLIEAVAF